MATKKTAPSTATAASKTSVAPSGTLQISKHFTLTELTRSETAARRGIDNTPPPDAIAALKKLCEAILEPLRADLGKPIHVSSAYRSPALNEAIGSKPTGQHPKGEAADFECFGFDNKALAERIIALKLPFDQLILEFYVPGDPNSGWVHVSHKLNGPQRGQVLRASSKGGKTVYTAGLG